jgi:hypothetical protein
MCYVCSFLYEVASSVARSLQAFNATPSKNYSHLGAFHRHKFFFITATLRAAIFLASFTVTFIAFHADPAVAGVFAVEVLPSPAGVPCLKLAFLLLLGSLLLATSLLLFAFLLLLECHKLALNCMATATFTATNFPQTFNYHISGKWP